MNFWPFTKRGPALDPNDVWTNDRAALTQALAAGADPNRKATLYGRPAQLKFGGRYGTSSFRTNQLNPLGVVFRQYHTDDMDLFNSLKTSPKEMDDRNQTLALLVQHGLRIETSDHVVANFLGIVVNQNTSVYGYREPLSNLLRVLDEAGADWNTYVMWHDKNMPFLDMVEDLLGKKMVQELTGGKEFLAKKEYEAAHREAAENATPMDALIEGRRARTAEAAENAGEPSPKKPRM